MTLYFDHASTSYPKNPVILAAATRFLETAGVNPGRGSYSLARQAEEMIEQTRASVASFVGAPREERVVFGLNCTDALNMALHGVLRRGDRVLLSRLVHNSLRRPLLQLAERGELELIWVDPLPSGRLDLNRWRAELERKPTALIACSHVSNVLGVIQPIAEWAALGKAHGALVLVDAAQSAGVTPLDMKSMGLDLLAFSAHKGLGSLPGVGVLCASEGVTLQRPWREGGTGADSLSPHQPREWPSVLEAGTPNLSGLAALREAISLAEGRSLERDLLQQQQWREELVQWLLDQGAEVFGETRPEASIGTVSFTLPSYPPQVVSAILDTSFNIAVRSGLHCAPETHAFFGTMPEGTVRVSFSHTTKRADFEKLKAALQAIARSK